jgi:hypothetical protein
MEKTMRKGLLTMAAVLAVGSLASISVQAAPTASRTAIAAESSVVAVHYAHSNRTHRHVVRQSGEITSFSSSSAAPAGLNVGVNHPAKK